MDNKITINVPFFGLEELSAVKRVFDSKWIGPGEVCNRFELDLKKLIGRNVLTLNSCTSALHIALKLLNVGHGDEVITTPLTYAATANVIEYCGAKTVFADVDFQSMNISHDEIERKITKKTKAIIVVHFAGLPCDMKRIMGFGIPVIEDCAHAIGATIEGKHCGTFGHAGCFSFYANKNITTVMGGAIVTPKMVRAKQLSNQGLYKKTWDRLKRGIYCNDMSEVGYEYQMSDVSAAIGIEQLKKLDSINGKREELSNYYKFHLGNRDRIYRHELSKPHTHDPIQSHTAS